MRIIWPCDYRKLMPGVLVRPLGRATAMTLAGLWALSSCGQSAPVASSGCDPLAAVQGDTDPGTLFVVLGNDSVPMWAITTSGPSKRLFEILDSGNLREVAVRGESRVRIDAQTTHALAFEEMDTLHTIFVLVDGDSPRSGLVVSGHERAEDLSEAQASDDGFALEIMNDTALPREVEWPLPQPIVTRFVATYEDAQLIVLLVPQRWRSDEQATLFSGTCEELDELSITAISRAQDGGSLSVSFERAGAPGRLFIPPPDATDAEETEPASLEIAGDTVPIDDRAPAANIQMCRFRCAMPAD